MAAEPRFCSNCRAALPPNEPACPACGVFAGEVYDERSHRPRTRLVPFATMLLFALIGGGAAIWWNAGGRLPRSGSAPERPQPPSVRVVGDRPGGARRASGAKLSEAEAMRLVRRHLVITRGLGPDCIVLVGGGFREGDYLVTARDHCASTRLGRWRVDGRTGEVAPAR